MDHSFPRRQFLKISGVSIIGMSVLGPALAGGTTKPLIIMEQAQGIVVADPMTCVGCGRCELACTEFNDGKAAPALSRIKVDRNLNFGSKAVFAGRQGEGNWGNGLVVQDLCKQCPHPVPCADACPKDAIVVAPRSNARVVDPDKCNGCKMCLGSCPWDMISFDPDSSKATKCFLCNGKPKCVEACPAESLSYVPWRNLTNKVPYRIATTAVIPPGKTVACQDCHLPGEQKVVKQGIRMVLEAVKSGKPLSLREFGFKWIDLVGTALLPAAVLFVGGHAVLRAVMNGKKEKACTGSDAGDSEDAQCKLEGPGGEEASESAVQDVLRVGGTGSGGDGIGAEESPCGEATCDSGRREGETPGVGPGAGNKTTTDREGD
jgi:Fe-S-cluster-containing dehydrogenase component